MGAGTLLEGTNGTYRILMSINAQADIEELTGVNLFELVQVNQTVSFLRKLFSVALRYGENDPSIDFVKAGEILDDVATKQGVNYLTKKLDEELNRAFGLKEEPQKSDGSKGDDGDQGKQKSLPMKK
ncbi:hypothetical protein HIU98_15745 [Enterococcus casseliflavus]|nr:hypothetical protein [Enterococcus casseliflavus]